MKPLSKTCEQGTGAHRPVTVPLWSPPQTLIRNMKHSLVFGGFWAFFILLSGSLVASYDGPLYDFTAYTECKAQPEEPLYQGGILKDEPPIMKPAIIGKTATGFYTPAFLLKNLTVGNFYCFSTWIKIQGANSALIRASLKTENRTYNCIGTVLAKNGCWSFLKELRW